MEEEESEVNKYEMKNKRKIKSRSIKNRGTKLTVT